MAMEFIPPSSDSNSADRAGPKQIPSHCVSDGPDKIPVPCKKLELLYKQCWPLTQFEVDSTVDFRAAFGLLVEEVQKSLS